jgi:hypothetical protein
MLVKLVEIKNISNPQPTFLSEIYINPSHIISVTEVSPLEGTINEAKNLGLIQGVKFSKVVMAEGSNIRTIMVVGAPLEVHSKLKKRHILRG